jgi:hypothetical protein
MRVSSCAVHIQRGWEINLSLKEWKQDYHLKRGVGEDLRICSIAALQRRAHGMGILFEFVSCSVVMRPGVSGIRDKLWRSAYPVSRIWLRSLIQSRWYLGDFHNPAECFIVIYSLLLVQDFWKVVCTQRLEYLSLLSRSTLLPWFVYNSISGAAYHWYGINHCEYMVDSRYVRPLCLLAKVGHLVMESFRLQKKLVCFFSCWIRGVHLCISLYELGSSCSDGYGACFHANR